MSSTSMHAARPEPQAGLSIPPLPSPTTTETSATSSKPTPGGIPSQCLLTPTSASPIKSVRRAAALQSLPRNVLAEIGYHLVVDESGIGHHPKHLMALLYTCKHIYYAIGFDHHPLLYNHLFRATFDWAAIQRRYEWMKNHMASKAKGAPKTFDLFEDPRAWAEDYKARWDLARRSKITPRPSGDVVPEEQEQYAADIWNYWFLFTENDGKNYRFMMEEMDMYAMLWHAFNRLVLPQGRLPGYPTDDPLVGLGIWTAIICGADLRRSYNAQQTDEKIFWLRPYVFACFKYDMAYAPWQQRQLPLCPPQCREHELDVTMKSKALPYKRFGYTWRRAPPHLTLGANLMLLRTMEKHRKHVIESPLTSRFAEQNEDPETHLYTSYEMISSLNHDREWQRNSVCQDPHTSFGLPPLAFHREMEGFWRGNFIHYSLDMYRKILAGDLRTLYTGEFSLQAFETEIKETVIKVRKDQVGGAGDILDAGFDATYPDPDREQERIRAGYGHALAEIDEPDEEGWTKEILLSGKAHMVLGSMSIRGRIRIWDGLVLMSCKNEHLGHPLAKYIWRGYIHTGGFLIGRWRDTFTPANFRGWEGGFVLVRAGSHVYPPSFPVRMTESRGINQSAENGLWSQVTPEPIRPEVEFTPAPQHAYPIPLAHDGEGEAERGSSRGSVGTISSTMASSSTTVSRGPGDSPSEVESPKQYWPLGPIEPTGPSGSAGTSSHSLKRARSESGSENGSENGRDKKGKGRALASDM